MKVGGTHIKFGCGLTQEKKNICPFLNIISMRTENFRFTKKKRIIGSDQINWSSFFIDNQTCFDPVISNKMIAERGRYDMTDKERRAFMRKFIDSGELRIRSDRTNTLEKMIADQMEWKFIFLEKLFIYNTLPRQFPIQLSLFWKIFFL